VPDPPAAVGSQAPCRTGVLRGFPTPLGEAPVAIHHPLGM